MTCLPDAQLLEFSTLSTSAPSIGIPRNRAQLRQRHLGLRQMPQELLRSRSSTCVAPSATWGVPLRDTSYMFRDNKTVVDSGSLPHAKLHKRHTMLSYHCIHEAIASGMVKFFHIPGEINPADILSKHWGHQQIWKQLQPLLFWKGDTRKLFEKKHCKEAYGIS